MRVNLQKTINLLIAIEFFAIKIFAINRFVIELFDIQHSVLIFELIFALNFELIFELNFEQIFELNFGLIFWLNFKQIFKSIFVLHFELNREKGNEVAVFEKSGLNMRVNLKKTINALIAIEFFAIRPFAIKLFNIKLFSATKNSTIKFFAMINAEQQLNKELQTKLEQIMLERNIERMTRKTEIQKEEQERMAWLEAEEIPRRYWPTEILTKFRAESADKSKVLDKTESRNNNYFKDERKKPEKNEAKLRKKPEETEQQCEIVPSFEMIVLKPEELQKRLSSPEEA